MKVLVITNQINGKLNPSIFNLFGAVKLLAESCDVFLAGYELTNTATEIATYASVNSVLTLDSPILDNLLAENLAPQLTQIVKNYTHVLVAADSFGKNLLPRIAGRLAIGQISEIVAIVSPQVFKRFSYTGNVLMETESLEEIKLLTVRAPNFEAEARLRNTPAEILNLAYTGQASNKIKLVSRNIIDKSVDLSSAKVVVSGGIALSSKQNFDELIRTLATKLTAAVGATRAAVEAGYAPNDCQVGQTGKIVAPEVYLAIGMSGAVQHIAGMKDSKTVIAINADRTAAIFDHADYGLVGDLFTLIPELIAKV